MTIKIKISHSLEKAVSENLGNCIDNPAIIKAVVNHYLNDCINREDIDVYIAQYLDGLKQCGDLDDIVYQATLE